MEQKIKKEKPATVTEYVVTEVFTGKKLLRESLLSLMIKDVKKVKSA